MKTSLYAFAALSIAALAGTSQGVVIVYNISLDGLQEVPPVATPASGAATITADTATRAVTVTGTFSNLIGTSNNAHVHGLSTFGVNSPPILNLAFDFGVTSGSFSGNGILSETNFQGLLDGLTYINIHSTFRPGGEIRGQIVPTPGALGLAIAALGLAAARRRR